MGQSTSQFDDSLGGANENESVTGSGHGSRLDDRGGVSSSTRTVVTGSVGLMGRRRRSHANANSNSISGSGAGAPHVVPTRRHTTFLTQDDGRVNVEDGSNNDHPLPTPSERLRSFRRGSADSTTSASSSNRVSSSDYTMMQRLRSAGGRILNGGRSSVTSPTAASTAAASAVNDILDEEDGDRATEMANTTGPIALPMNDARYTPSSPVGHAHHGVPRLISGPRARFDDSPRHNSPSRHVARDGPTFIPSSPTSPLGGGGGGASGAVGTTTPASIRPVYRRMSSGNASNASAEDSDWVDNNSDAMSDFHNQIFYPLAALDYEWMGRSIETLILGHAVARAPILQLVVDNFSVEFEGGDGASYYEFDLRRRSTASTFGGSRRRSTAGSYQSGRRCSLSLSGVHMHGGTMANYYNNRNGSASGGGGGGSSVNQAFRRPSDVDRSVQERQGRRCSTANGLQCRRRSSMASSVAVPSIGDDKPKRVGGDGGGGAGPNVLFNIMARESTGKSVYAKRIPESQKLRQMGGATLFNALDKPADGMANEVAVLAAAIDIGDWAETHSILSRLVVRLIGDPSQAAAAAAAAANGTASPRMQDPNLPRTAHRFYAGGGRLGLERDAFVMAGGVPVLIRIFREKSFVGQEMAQAYDARYLSEGIVASRFAPCWNEALASLRELVYYMPSLVEGGAILDDGDFLPFLFTLLSHDTCFDCAAALIEEMLSFMSQTQQQHNPSNENGVTTSSSMPPLGRATPASTFYLGNIPDLYKLWRRFNCRQLAHFCRILALLVFEPEDRQLLENPAVLKSQELLQLRRNRAVRAARDATVDMNQAIVLGDDELMKRLLKLLGIMNYAPPLRRFAPYHVMAHFPFIADTLVMLGLSELDDWDEMDRQDRLARKLLDGSTGAGEVALSELGSIADMLDSLSTSLTGSNRQPNQIGHIITVISAAQQAGVIVGRNRNGSRNRAAQRRQQSRGQSSGPGESEGAVAGIQAEDGTDAAAESALGDVAVLGASLQGLASVAGILSDQILVRRLYPDEDADDITDGASANRNVDSETRYEPRHIINTPEDAANSLQFNAMMFGPYQVEVLFVLCTLLGGRRKLDAQDCLNQHGIMPVLEGMFQRLPWYKAQNQSDADTSQRDNLEAAHQPNGIHGPGCECTPESALCVQYLRMLHNFCDRDCDNYEGRRLLLSDDEIMLIDDPKHQDTPKAQPGLLTKIITAFVGESDESPYRFWLASCIESFLRGSSPSEQMFVAQSGLLDYLVEEISSDRLHCAGSLQTSFDLLGELSKGSPDVILRLVNNLDEESFKKLMSVAAANLVDSNVFIRSLLLSLERLSSRVDTGPLYLEATDRQQNPWVSPHGDSARSYLTHSWWDMPSVSLTNDEPTDANTDGDIATDEFPTDWFPSQNLVHLNATVVPRSPLIPSGSSEVVGHFGWIFTPVGDRFIANTYLPNTVERLSWFLAANQARLLRDLLVVVDLRNINHENICCLNTAVVIAIFAHRRQQLALLLQELRQMSTAESRRDTNDVHHDQVVDRAFAQAMRYLDLSNQQRENLPGYARRASLTNSTLYSSSNSGATDLQIGDRTDVMRNFREVLWFWMEYYTHRGRDRLSLEFSSHIRFQEWNHVVSLLVADDDSSTSLVRTPICLPRSPYQRAARVADGIARGD